MVDKNKISSAPIASVSVAPIRERVMKEKVKNLLDVAVFRSSLSAMHRLEGGIGCLFLTSRLLLKGWRIRTMVLDRVRVRVIKERSVEELMQKTELVQGKGLKRPYENVDEEVEKAASSPLKRRKSAVGEGGSQGPSSAGKRGRPKKKLEGAEYPDTPVNVASGEKRPVRPMWSRKI